MSLLGSLVGPIDPGSTAILGFILYRMERSIAPRVSRLEDALIATDGGGEDG